MIAQAAVRKGFQKYHAKRTPYAGKTYASRGEAGLAMELDLRVRAGDIARWQSQVAFVLYGMRGRRICEHVVDFVVEHNDGSTEAIEFKGKELALWKIKRALFQDNYPSIKYTVRRRVRCG